MVPVEFAEVVQQVLLGFAPQVRGRVEVFDARLARPDRPSPDRSTAASRWTSDRADHRRAARIGKGNEGRQVLRRRAECVDQPVPKTGWPADDPPGSESVDRLAVIVDPGVHGTDDRDVVDHFARHGSNSVDSMPDWPVLAELPGAAEDLGTRLGRVVVLDGAGERLAVERVSSGFGSSRSMWLGPPCMNREIIALARGAGARSCGFRSKICVPGRAWRARPSTAPPAGAARQPGPT